MSRARLSGLVAPHSVVLVGASLDPATLGGALTRNLVDGGYAGAVHFVNPKYREILGRPCLPELAAIDAAIDLALIITPSHTVQGIVEQCGRQGIRFVIILSSGFAETGEIGACVEAQVLATARRWGVRVFGPRALGFIRPALGLNATPFYRRLPPGNMAFVAQSGSVCTSVLDWAFNNEFALSAVFAPGNGSDIDLPEILDFLAADPETTSILLYLEGVRASRPFLSAMRAAARTKPVVVVKAGTTGVTAALSRRHIQSEAGGDEAFTAAISRVGALRVPAIGDLFTAARALSAPKRPQGNRLAIVANGGGPAVMAVDAAARTGIPLARFSPDTKARLAMRFPLSWSETNPIDLLLDADAGQYETAIGTALADPGVDCLLVIIAPTGLAEPTVIAQRIAKALASSEKPALVCVLGETSVTDVRHLLTKKRIPTFRTVENAISALAFMIDFARNQRLLLEAPPSAAMRTRPAVAEALTIIESALAERRTVLRDGEARQLAAAFHVGIAPDVRGASGHSAIRLARDAVWGPVLRIVDGSNLAFPVSPCALPPLNDRLIGELLASPALGALLGDADVIARLRNLLLAVSDMACELPWIEALTLHVALGDGQPTGIDIAVREWSGNPSHYGHMVICPYPQRLETEMHMRDGTPLHIRPIRPEDAHAFQAFVRSLDERSRYFRFFGSRRELLPAELTGYTQIDYDREMSLVAVTAHSEAGGVVGEARYTLLADGATCEFGIVVADACAGHGIGRQLMVSLMAAAGQRGVTTMVGEVLADNLAMLKLMAALGFVAVPTSDPEIVAVSRTLA